MKAFLQIMCKLINNCFTIYYFGEELLVFLFQVYLQKFQKLAKAEKINIMSKRLKGKDLSKINTS